MKPLFPAHEYQPEETILGELCCATMTIPGPPREIVCARPISDPRHRGVDDDALGPASPTHMEWILGTSKWFVDGRVLLHELHEMLTPTQFDRYKFSWVLPRGVLGAIPEILEMKILNMPVIWVPDPKTPPHLAIKLGMV